MLERNLSCLLGLLAFELKSTQGINFFGDPWDNGVGLYEGGLVYCIFDGFMEMKIYFSILWTIYFGIIDRRELLLSIINRDMFFLGVAQILDTYLSIEVHEIMPEISFMTTNLVINRNLPVFVTIYIKQLIHTLRFSKSI